MMTATFSEDRKFRYTLTRVWDAGLPKVAFIGLNPSTADEEQDDPTIRRCVGFARRWGYGGILMLNLYAFRATKPADMWKEQKRGVDVIGGERNWVDSLKRYAAEHDCGIVIAAWGSHGRKRGPDVFSRWSELKCLAVNADRTPKHPLYLRGDLVPLAYGTGTEQGG
jgi:hypothetical protein